VNEGGNISPRGQISPLGTRVEEWPSEHPQMLEMVALHPAAQIMVSMPPFDYALLIFLSQLILNFINLYY
jgi:hypothetical protein